MTEWASGYVTDIGYTHGFYRELTPAFLTSVLLARGLRSFDVNAPLTFCELGCGQGFSVNLLAAANPHIEFYATDFNPAQIASAQMLAREAETSNVHFFDDSFADFLHEPSLPKFDVIALHGIYSWIRSEHRGQIVEFIHRKLKPGGLVYISYNSMPGWAASAPLRHLMYIHGKHVGGSSASKLPPAFEFIEKLIDAEAGFFKMNPLVIERFNKIRKQRPDYLAHEFLNEVWTPFHHSDVVEELGAAKLTYAGSATLFENLDLLNLTPQQEVIVAQCNDPTLKETIRDFAVNRQFRRDVFVRGPVSMPMSANRIKWLDSRFSLSTPRLDVPLTIKTLRGDFNLNAEVYGSVLDGFAKGPATIRQIVAQANIAAFGWDKLLQSLIILMGAGHLQPCLDERGDSKRAQRTKFFNRAVMGRAMSSSDLEFLASPVTGGGIYLDRFAQMFLHAQNQKQDPVQFVQDLLSRAGERLGKDDKPFDTLEEQLSALRERYVMFEKKLPILKQLGVA